MGTRGAMGFRIDGIDKIGYNHFDSYPSGLGAAMVADLHKILTDPARGMDWLRVKARELRSVDEQIPAEPEDIAKYAPYLDITVSKQTWTDWYALTRKLHGELEMTLQAGVILKSEEFMRDSLFCEYAYIVNLDDNTFECYQGFQKEPHTKGRFADDAAKECVNGTCYYAVALVHTFPLDPIPQDWEKIAYPPEDEDEEEQEPVADGA